MKKGLIIALVMLLAVLAISSTITTSTSTNYSKIGVRKGDTADYSVSYTSGSSPSRYSKTHIEVTSVMGTNVSLQITYTFPDQRTQTEIYNADISRQRCYYLTVAGLHTGDPVCIGGYTTVSETITTIIFGTERFINVVEQSRILDNQQIQYYDKETGILVRSLRSSLAFGWMEETITETSTLLPTNWTGLYLVIGFTTIIATVITIGFLNSTRRRRPTTNTNTPH